MKKHCLHYLLIIMMLSIGMGLGSCRKKQCHDPKNPECENYDPCYGKKPVTADFIFGRTTATPEPINGVDYPICEDTIFNSGGVNRKGFDYGIGLKFQAKENGAKYTWKLGSETISGREFDRNFITAGPGVYQATLIVEKTPDASCFPKDDGKDTITKKFTLMPHYQLPIMGKYKVLFEGSKDSTIIEIQPWEISSSTQFKNYKIVDSASVQYTTLINFQNKRDTVTHFLFDGFPTGNHIYLFDAPSDYHPHSGKVDLKGSQIAATYHYGASWDGSLVKYVFKGRKLK
jgi:hypothetical protein